MLPVAPYCPCPTCVYPQYTMAYVPQPAIVGKPNFTLVRKLGVGTFGEVFMAKDFNTGEEVAIKRESSKAKYQSLPHETNMLYLLQGGFGIPHVLYGAPEKDYNVMIMDLLGPSIESLFDYCNRRFSLKTVLMLALQMIDRVEYIHNKSIIHRDLKPDNFMMGLGKYCSYGCSPSLYPGWQYEHDRYCSRQVFLADFGLAKIYRHLQTGVHIEYCQGKSFTGTARYSSRNALEGCEQSRRDDMESLGYVFMYLLRGSLPWQGIKAATSAQKLMKVKEKKLGTSDECLCQGYDGEFVDYMRYCRLLQFEETPNYNYLRQLLYRVFYKYNYQFDFMYDWNIITKTN